MRKTFVAAIAAVLLTPAAAPAHVLTEGGAKSALMGYYHDDDVRDYARRKGYHQIEWGRTDQVSNHKIHQVARYYMWGMFMEKACFKAWVYDDWNVIFDELRNSGPCP